MEVVESACLIYESDERIVDATQFYKTHAFPADLCKTIKTMEKLNAAKDQIALYMKDKDVKIAQVQNLGNKMGVKMASIAECIARMDFMNDHIGQTEPLLIEQQQLDTEELMTRMQRENNQQQRAQLQLQLRTNRPGTIHMPIQSQAIQSSNQPQAPIQASAPIQAPFSSNNPFLAHHAPYLSNPVSPFNPGYANPVIQNPIYANPSQNATLQLLSQDMQKMQIEEEE